MLSLSKMERSWRLALRKRSRNFKTQRLKSITLWAAYQHYEEANRGSIEVGKLADVVVLDKNPHSIPIEELANLKVLQTIKEGKTIYAAP